MGGAWLAAVLAGAFNPHSSRLDASWTLHARSSLSSEDFKSCVHAACGGSSKSDSVYVSFLQVLAYRVPVWESWNFFSLYGLPHLGHELTTIKHEICWAIVEMASHLAGCTESLVALPVPIVSRFGDAVEFEVIGTPRFSERLECSMWLNGFRPIPFSTLCGSKELSASLQRTTGPDWAGFKLQPPKEEVRVTEPEVKSVWFVHLQLQAHINPIVTGDNGVDACLQLQMNTPN